MTTDNRQHLVLSVGAGVTPSALLKLCNRIRDVASHLNVDVQFPRMIVGGEALKTFTVFATDSIANNRRRYIRSATSAEEAESMARDKFSSEQVEGELLITHTLEGAYEDQSSRVYADGRD